MKLYIVCSTDEYDNTDIIAVYDNKEKAEELIKDSMFYIEERELNKEMVFDKIEGKVV
jgi:hypothetical protein